MVWLRRPMPFCDPESAGGGAPEAKVEAAETAVEAAEAAVEKAEATGDPKAISAAESRLKAAEDRLAKAETDLADLRQHVEGKAQSDHSHEMPGELKALQEHLTAVEAEESAPAGRRHWLYKPLGRRAS